MNRTRYNSFSKALAMNVLLLLLLSTIVSPAFAEPVRVAVLKSHNTEPYQFTQNSFQKHLRKQKLDVTYTEFLVNENENNSLQIIDQLKQWNPDLIFSLGNKATNLSTKNIRNIPIVTSLVLASDYSSFMGVAGVRLGYSVDTELKMLQQLLPEHKNVGVLYSSDENSTKILEAKQLAGKYGLKITAIKVNSPKEIPKALESVMNNSDVLWGIPDHTVLSASTSKAVLLASFRNKIPFIGLSSNWVKAGALYSLDWNYSEIGHQAAEEAAAILHGRSDHTAKLSYPNSISYSLNLKTAKRMKITFAKENISKAKNVYK